MQLSFKFDSFILSVYILYKRPDGGLENPRSW